MGRVPPNLLVAVQDNVALIRIIGRASFTFSVPFKTLIHELRQRGFLRFVLDLTECVTMDSTFLGVMAGLVLRGTDEPPIALELLNPSDRVADLLENLGIAHLFKVQKGPAPLESQFDSAHDQQSPTREELTETSLEAHQTLMSANPDNVARFKEVAQFLAEDMKKLKDRKQGPKP
jgi:anti-sigma B factor antagonist